ncbi:hypothetical protein P5673_031276 [Acropora cervicornis]|uniref:Uncharacterized protein n=1 Tax=Acropora cervicornis TaxID=6130 RepID=A0AAD9USM1_ACRCE|nr:hypothetical protein P5673_031276 [Acropora cervicornis]
MTRRQTNDRHPISKEQEFHQKSTRFEDHEHLKNASQAGREPIMVKSAQIDMVIFGNWDDRMYRMASVTLTSFMLPTLDKLVPLVTVTNLVICPLPALDLLCVICVNLPATELMSSPFSWAHETVYLKIGD